MDLYHFINSPDIREHLQKIRYEFSPAEAAWFVYICRSATLEEKYSAWQEIIDTMPDEAIDTDLDETPNNLHEYLAGYMEKLKELTEILYRSEPGVVYGFCDGEKNGSRTNERGPFSDFSRCFSAAVSQASRDRIKLCRMPLNDTESIITAELCLDGGLLSVRENSPTKARSILSDGFDTMYFSVPTPFGKGDIVRDPWENDACGPFVLTETEDNFPKYPSGIFQDAHSGEIHTSTWFWLANCEYYRGDLNGKRRILTALSNYIKGKIDVCVFARAYYQVLLEERAKDLPRNVSAENLKVAWTRSAEPKKRRK